MFRALPLLIENSLEKRSQTNPTDECPSLDSSTVLLRDDLVAFLLFVDGGEVVEMELVRDDELPE